MEVLALTFLIALACAIPLYLWYVFDIFQNQRPGRVLLVNTDLRVVGPPLCDVILRHLPHPERVACVELGAGLARVSRFLERAFPWNQVVAVDSSFYSYSWGRFFNWVGGSRVRYRREDVFAVIPPPGALLYCYLSTEILRELHRRGAFTGCLVVTLTFDIPNVTPQEIVSLAGWQRSLTVDDFRAPTS